MDTATYEKIIIEDPEFPVVVLKNDKYPLGHRHQICPPHWHEHTELHYICQGSLDITVNQGQHTLQAGDLIVINGSDIHSSSYSGRLRERILIFRPDALSPYLSKQVPAFQRIIRDDSTVMQLMTAIDLEYTQANLGYTVICKGLLLQLLTHLARNYALSFDSRQEYSRRKQQLQRLLPVREYIEAHLAEPLDSKTLATLIYVSPDRFHHLFKECMGIPLRQYINNIRLHTAMGWLEKDLCTPSEAAARVGFTDYNHFGRLFRQTFGCAPSQIHLRKTAK